MTPTRHVIVDLETLATTPAAYILTIGAVAVEISGDGLTVLSRYYRHVAGPQPGRSIDTDTINWWLEQSREAHDEAFGPHDDRLPLWLAVASFDTWLRLHPYPVWGNGADFDNAILAHAFRQHGHRWPFWQNRCLRSTKGLVQQLNPGLALPEFPTRLVKHIAIDDAEHEAEVLAALLMAATAHQPDADRYRFVRDDLIRRDDAEFIRPALDDMFALINAERGDDWPTEAEFDTAIDNAIRAAAQLTR